MPELNLTQAAATVGISRQTLYQHLKSGKVSATIDKDRNRVIHTSELIRAYGELVNIPDAPDTSTPRQSGHTLTSKETALSDTTDTNNRALVHALGKQVDFLIGQLEKADEEKKRLLGLLETKLLEDQRQPVKWWPFWRRAA